MAEKVVLAYSGGLDTSAIIPWLKETYGYDVIAFCADLGQGVGEPGVLEKKALASGASKVYIENMTEEFVTDYIWPTLKAHAVYETKYLLGTSFDFSIAPSGRPPPSGFAKVIISGLTL